MKDALLKVVRSPKVRAAAVALVLAVAAALGIGCGGAGLPALPPEAVQAVAAAKCVERVLADVGDPNDLTLGEARELAKSLRACAEPPAPVGDAGP